MTARSASLRESTSARWFVLFLVAFTMFAVYVASDIFSPLKTMLEEDNLWTSSEYGLFSGSYSLFNVFLGMLIFGGLVLDKMGIRFTGILSCILVVGGMSLKYWALTTNAFTIDDTVMFFGGRIKEQVFWVCMGFATFGVGAEVAGVTVLKAIDKWFTGKELALAMGLQLALARLGSGAALAFSPMIANHFHNVSSSVLASIILLVVGFLCYIIYTLYDKKLDHQLHMEAMKSGEKDEESFNLKDVKAIVSNQGFWLIAVLCLLFYAAIFPFLKYASDLMVNKFSVDPKVAGLIPSMLPFGCIILTPLFGRIYDKVGHGVDLMIGGAALITVVHLIFTLPFITQWYIAVILMILLGIGFAMVPAAMWPALAKIIPQRQFGTAMALTFYIQNIGLWGMPLLIGHILDKYCVYPAYKAIVNPILAQHLTEKQTVDAITSATVGVPHYDYTLPMLVFVITCGVSVFVAFSIKWLDKRKGYGLQEANIKK